MSYWRPTFLNESHQSISLRLCMHQYRETIRFRRNWFFFSFSGLRSETFLFRLDVNPLKPTKKFFKNQNVDCSLIEKGGANCLFLVHSMYQIWSYLILWLTCERRIYSQGDEVVLVPCLSIQASFSAQLSIENGTLLPKLFWPTVKKNRFSDQENFLRSLEQFIQTVKGQNNLW